MTTRFRFFLNLKKRQIKKKKFQTDYIQYLLFKLRSAIGLGSYKRSNSSDMVNLLDKRIMCLDGFYI